MSGDKVGPQQGRFAARSAAQNRSNSADNNTVCDYNALALHPFCSASHSEQKNVGHWNASWEARQEKVSWAEYCRILLPQLAEKQSSVLHLSSVWDGVYQKFESKVYVIPGGAISFEKLRNGQNVPHRIVPNRPISTFPVQNLLHHHGLFPWSSSVSLPNRKWIQRTRKEGRKEGQEERRGAISMCKIN